jgi:GMP synthase (glutamine-hydrolysing)
VGVQGDFRTYRFPAVLAINDSKNIDWDAIEALSSRLTNAVPEVNRLVAGLFRREGTLRLQPGFCDKARLDQTREVDAIVIEELHKSGWYGRIFQHLTINLPFATDPAHCSIVLRPVVSEDVMTARFARLPPDLLAAMVTRISRLPFVDAIFYDVTNKPPATFGWE